MASKMYKNVEIICPHCGYGYSNVYVVDGPKGTGKRGLCNKCLKVTIDEHTPNPNYVEPDPPTQQRDNKPTVTCPYCNSTNCKKISTSSKVGKVLMWGILAADSVGKTWHCNNCGSNFG